MAELERQSAAIGIPDKRIKKALDARAALIATAEQQLATAIELQEPEWSLEGLLILGRMYESVGNDIAAAPAPQLSPDQLTVYKREIAKKAEAVWTKAYKHYSLGIDFADRVTWESARVSALEQQRDAVMAKLERDRRE